MADNFGLKIGIEGEKEFKKALSEINQSFKVLGSEMKLVSSQLDKNDKSVQALSARNTVLNKEIEAQKNKVETLRAALQNAADSFGENDRRTQNWQIQLNNAEAALNSMERELSDNERAIEALSQEETDAADATQRLSREIAQQEDALAGMKRAYSNAVLQYGKGSSEAKELEGRISQLSGELRENRERMKDAGDVAEDLGDSLEDASEGADKLGSGLSVATAAKRRRSLTTSFTRSLAIRIRQRKRHSFWHSLPKTSRTSPSGQTLPQAFTALLAMPSPSRA